MLLYNLGVCLTKRIIVRSATLKKPYKFISLLDKVKLSIVECSGEYLNRETVC